MGGCWACLGVVWRSDMLPLTTSANPYKQILLLNYKYYYSSSILNHQSYCQLILTSTIKLDSHYNSITKHQPFQNDYEQQNIKIKPITMGNYNNLPKRAPLDFVPTAHEFQSTYVQRIKETPFSFSQPYSINPPIFIDPIGITMRQLLQPRVSTPQLFPPSEVIKIAENVISGLEQLQDHRFKSHGDLSLDTIYYDKRTKTFKVSHPVFSPESAYQLCRQSKRFSFLSPQQLLALTDPYQKQQNITSIKSDLFVLGVILLEISTLLPSNEIYCPDTYVIFDKEIQNRVDLVKEYYGGDAQSCDKIMKILTFLLEYDETKRKQCREILWQIQQDENKRNIRQLPIVGKGPNTFIRN